MYIFGVICLFSNRYQTAFKPLIRQRAVFASYSANPPCIGTTSR